ncbi:hypothetical protein KAR91_06375 [Candidatus Pacearchaeota archaeon]|nr:hypothetical protein [Candidatus Pacearchaeota archaeon]
MNFWKPNTLFCEGKDKNMSIGRVSLWATLIPAVYLWWKGQDIQTHHLYALGFLLLYNGWKKIPMFIKLINAWKGNNVG